jgi:uncharacterized protein (DUF1501 family)
MTIWHSAKVDLPRFKEDIIVEEDRAVFGWIGQPLDEGDNPASGAPGAVFVGGGGTRVYYTSQAGYDTHYLQLLPHALLLGELSGALKAFLYDLAAARLAERVLVLCFSEFGRRVKENGSQGTDHGTAGPVLLAGPGVRAGLVGEAPRLLDLHEGDLKLTIDFRRVYATVLENWLGLPSKPALGGVFEKPPLFRL